MSPSESIDIMLTPKKDIMLMVVLCSATANAPQRLNSGTRYSPPTFEYPQIVLPEGHDFTIFSGEKRAFRTVRRTAKGWFCKEICGCRRFYGSGVPEISIFLLYFCKNFSAFRVDIAAFVSDARHSPNKLTSSSSVATRHSPNKFGLCARCSIGLASALA